MICDRAAKTSVRESMDGHDVKLVLELGADAKAWP
jgi:hypothetical protein